MAEKDLQTLLQNMSPKLQIEEYVFCTSKKPFAIQDPLFTFKEKEGISYVLIKKQADLLGVSYVGIWSLITLEINSDLAAVGFLAKITTALANKGVSVNAVSAYYHDHLFVPKDKAQIALKILKKLQKQSVS